MKIMFAVVILLLLGPAEAAGEPVYVYCKDGTVITAHIISFEEDRVKMDPDGPVSLTIFSFSAIDSIVAVSGEPKLIFPVTGHTSIPDFGDYNPEERRIKRRYPDKNRVYLGVKLIGSGIGGDFDGSTVLTTGDELFIVPKVKWGLGLGFHLGFLFDTFKTELGYLQSQHNADWSWYRYATIFRMIYIETQYLLIPRSEIQPYFSFGVCFPWLTVEEGSLSDTGRIDDATFSAIPGYRFGLGIELYLNSRLSFRVGYSFNWIEYEFVKGARNDTVAIEDKIDGTGQALFVSTNITL